MAETYKPLAQSAPPATTLTDAYTVPGATSAIISTITVCNRGASTSFRISVAIAGAGDDPVQYLYHDLPLPANDTFVLTLGITLAATDVLRVYSDSGDVSFNVFGLEKT